MLELLRAWFPNVLSVSVTTGVVLAVLLLASPALAGRVKARWWCLAWVLLALRLVVPLQLSFPAAPVEVTLPGQQEVVLQQPEEVPLAPPASPGEATPEAAPVSPAAAGEAAAPALDLTWLDLAALGWAAGGAVFLLWQGGRYLIFRRRLLREAQPFPAGDALAQTVAQALGGGKAIPVVVCAAAPSPLTLGLLHPRVVLPREDYSREALAGILCHELAHWQGGHLWGKLLLLLARGIHWFNPLVHLAARQADRDLELACDDRVLAQATPAQRKAYAHTLLSVMEADTRPAVFLTTQLQGGKHVMKARFYNLFHPVTSRWGKLLPAAALAVVLLAGGLVSCTGTLSTADTALRLPAQGTYAGEDLGVTTVAGEVAVLRESGALSHWFTLDQAEGTDRYQFLSGDQPQPLQQGDLVLVTGTVDGQAQVMVVGTEAPALQGTLPTSILSTDPADLAQANQAQVAPDRPTYGEPNGPQTGATQGGVVSVLAREGDWAQIEAPGGSGPVWVQAEELDYALSDQSLVTVDLSRYQGQGALWVRTQEAPGLQDYAAEDALTAIPENWTLPAGTLGDFTRTEVKNDLLLYGESYETVMPEGFSVARYADGGLTPVYTFEDGATVTWQAFFSPDGTQIAFPWAPWEGEQGIQAEDWQVRVVDLGTGEETDLTLPAWEGHPQEMVCVQWIDDHALQVTAYDLTAMQSGAADASITWTCTLAG